MAIIVAISIHVWELNMKVNIDSQLYGLSRFEEFQKKFF